MTDEQTYEDNYQINLNKKEYDLLFDIVENFDLTDTVGLKEIFEDLKRKVNDPIDLNQ